MDFLTPKESAQKPSKPKRRWFQFSLRTLLLMMLVFGCGLGWVASERQKNAKLHADIVAIRDLDGHVAIEGRKAGRPAWLHWLLGDDSFRNVTAVSLTSTEITDAGLEHFKDLTQVQWLNLANTQITDAGIVRWPRIDGHTKCLF